MGIQHETRRREKKRKRIPVARKWRGERKEMGKKNWGRIKKKMLFENVIMKPNTVCVLI